MINLDRALHTLETGVHSGGFGGAARAKVGRACLAEALLVAELPRCKAFYRHETPVRTGKGVC